MTAKNIWLAENVLEILTEQRYGCSSSPLPAEVTLIPLSAGLGAGFMVTTR